MTDWLSVTLGDAPLIVSIPHAGTIIPEDISGLLSLDLARRDAGRRYAFATDFGATIIPNRHNGASCDAVLTDAIAADRASESYVIIGRINTGWITCNYGKPARGVDAVQMEPAIRGYADEDGAWPPPWDAARVVPMQAKLHNILST